jgi:hypothetical protein
MCVNINTRTPCQLSTRKTNDLKLSQQLHPTESSWGISRPKWLKENNVVETTTFSNLKTLVSLNYLTQVMAQEDFTECKLQYRRHETDELNISHLITNAISFVIDATIQKLFFTLSDQ